MGSLLSSSEDNNTRLQNGDETAKKTEIAHINVEASNSIVVINLSTTSRSEEAQTLFNCNFQDNNNCINVVGEGNSVVTKDCALPLQKHSPQSVKRLPNWCEKSPEPTASEHLCPSTQLFKRESLSFGVQVKKCPDNKHFRLLLRTYRKNTNHLHYLRDKGSYEELEKQVEKIEVTEGGAELKVFMLVERSITLCYRKELQKCQEILLQALKLIPHSKPSAESFLIALCQLYLGSLHRREGKLDLAERCVQVALQQLEFLPLCELRALAVYERGSILGRKADEHSHSARGGNGKYGSKLAETTENDLKQSVRIFLELIVEDKDLYMRKHIFALCKIAITKLKCDSTTERNSRISDACIRDARNCIKTVQRKYGVQIPPAAQIQLHVAKSDYNFRMGKYRKAQKFAGRALDAAEILNMNLELSRIRDRLDAIQLLTKQ